MADGPRSSSNEWQRRRGNQGKISLTGRCERRSRAVRRLAIPYAYDICGHVARGAFFGGTFTWEHEAPGLHSAPEVRIAGPAN